MKVDFSGSYRTMLAQGEKRFPPQALKYLLRRIGEWATARQSAKLHPPGLIRAFEEGAVADFGPFAKTVLEDWGMESPARLGEALHLLGRHDCLVLDEEDGLEKFSTAPWTLMASMPKQP